MIDQNKELIFGNILPREIGKNSKELDFHDQNDLYEIQKRVTTEDLQRKPPCFFMSSNLLFLLLLIWFFCRLM